MRLLRAQLGDSENLLRILKAEAGEAGDGCRPVCSASLGEGPARHLCAHHHDLGQVLGQGACAASGAWVPASRPCGPLAFFLLIRNLVYVQSRKLGKFYNRQQQIEQEKFS